MSELIWQTLTVSAMVRFPGLPPQTGGEKQQHQAVLRANPADPLRESANSSAPHLCVTLHMFIGPLSKKQTNLKNS